MKRLLRCCGAGFVFTMLAFAALTAHALTPMELQRLLQSAARPTLKFQEVRESPWLAAPVTSSGTLRSTPDALEKRVESPRPEVWRLLADRVEWQGAGEGGVKQIRHADVPALAALSDVMRRVVAGDLVALQRDFDIAVSGDERVWRVLLKPKNPSVARQLEQVELQGTGALLQVIIVVERQGERTTTRLQP
jgi:hypothetical protein